MSAVKAASLNPSAFVRDFSEAAAAQGFRLERFGEIANCPLVAATKRTRGMRPRIYVSTGIHGDEPAGPHALLELLKAGVFDARATWFLCPLLNPAGFLRATRENAEGLDLNRDYKDLRSAEIRAHGAWLQRQPNFDVTLCLHEDWESAGFYLYELNPANQPTLADAMIAAVRKVCPIETAAIIDGRESAEPGIIRPIADPLLREMWPEAIYLRAHHTTLSYTLESPSALTLEARVAALRAAVEAALAEFTRTARTMAG